MMRKARYIDAADVAKMIRKNLKSRFPGVKFSVRTSKYSGGASVDVRWFDGPTQREVEEVVKRYQGATFDGMTDLKEYLESVVAREDGTPELVRFGADFVFAERRYSPDFLRGVAARVAREWGLDAPEVLVSDFDGSGWIDTYNTIRLPGDAYRTLGEAIMAEASQASAD